jgi:hypothetical protein
MWSQEEVWTHFFREDKILAPMECYQEWDEQRPCVQNTRLDFTQVRRVKDVLYALASYYHQRQPGSLCRGSREMRMIAQLITGETLRRCLIRYDRVMIGVELFANGLHTFVFADRALEWL